MRGRIVCFGEVLLRLAAPPGRLPLNASAAATAPGGADANVAVSLALLGHRTAMVSVLPDNALGRIAVDTLDAHGVDTSGIRLLPGRMGLYFLAPGAVGGASEIVYDRAGSAYALAGPGAYDWPALLDGAAWLHVSGIAPGGANGPAHAVPAALRTARAAGVRVAIDASDCASPWQAQGPDAAAPLRHALGHADVLFAAPHDLAAALGRPELADPAHDTDAARAAFAAFPRLTLLAWTRCAQADADAHELSATLHTRTKTVTGGSYRLSGSVDRIGTGAAFAAGVLHGLQCGMAPDDVAGFALAAAALKHAIADDAMPARAGWRAPAHTGGFDAGH
ncbi:sugar kinase [Massilia sp. TW-1]|uniref:Sugar kinase n=2 Tax=Telluria antibiotica TaxID=2717319 RepID=A0ABX0PF75_9BURK|nr:sugar kinase [Telluria antibiotica]